MVVEFIKTVCGKYPSRSTRVKWVLGLRRLGSVEKTIRAYLALSDVSFNNVACVAIAKGRVCNCVLYERDLLGNRRL